MALHRLSGAWVEASTYDDFSSSIHRQWKLTQPYEREEIWPKKETDLDTEPQYIEFAKRLVGLKLPSVALTSRSGWRYELEP